MQPPSNLELLALVQAGANLTLDALGVEPLQRQALTAAAEKAKTQITFTKANMIPQLERMALSKKAPHLVHFDFS